MTRRGHHSHQHHHHSHGGGGIQHATGVVLLGAAAAAAAANHFASQGSNNARQQRRDVIIVQQQSPTTTTTTATIDPAHPPYLHLMRPGQRSMLVLNDGSRQRAPGWRLRGHCELCLTRFSIFTRRHHCRNCGRSVCWRHSAHKAPLPHFGFLQYVRVCAHCHPALLDCYRSGRPYSPTELQRQRIQQQQPPSPYAGPDNLASYVRPAAQGSPIYAPVTATAVSTSSNAYTTALPRAELIYDGTSSAVAAPTPPPPTAPPSGAHYGVAVATGQGQPGVDAYRLNSGTALW